MFVIQSQTCTATTGGIAQASTSPAVSRIAHDRAHLRQQQRDQRADPDRQRDVGDREDDRPHQDVPEDGVVQDRAVVGPADARAVVRDQLEEPVLLEREPGEVVERVAEDRRDRQRRPGGSAGTAPRRAGARANVNGRRRRGRRAASAANAVPPGISLLVKRLPVVIWSLLVERELDVAVGERGRLRDARLPGEDPGQHRAEDVAVLDVDPVLRGRDEPAALAPPAR